MQRSCGDSSNLVPAKCQRLVFCDTHPLCLPRQPLIVSGQANVVDQPSGLRQSPAPTKTSLILLPWWTSTSQLQSPSLSKTSGADCQPPRGRIFPRCKTRKTERGATQAAQNEQIPLNSFHSIHSPPLCLILCGRGSRLFAVWEFEQTKLFACCCIYSECNGPAGGRGGYVDLAAKCQTCVAASLLATHELQELFTASPPIMFEIKSWQGYWI